MSNQPRRGAAQPADSHRGLRLLGLAAVTAGVLLLMAAAFVLSYTGIHAVALSAGVSPRFARIYPLIFDAMLVVACAAVLALRGAGLPSRCYAWLTMLVLLAAAAGADTLHATNTKLPHKPAAATAAILPWALVLIGFGLLLSMLRHARLRRAMAGAAPERVFTQPSGHVEVQQRHGLDELFGPRSSPVADAVTHTPPPARVLPAADAAPDLAIESDPGHDDPSSDEGHPAARIGERQQQAAGHGGNSATPFSPAPTVDLRIDTGAAAARAPVRDAGTATVPGPRIEPAKPGPAPETRPAAPKPPAAEPAPAAKPAGGPKSTAEAGPEVTAEPRPTPETDRAPEPAAEPAAEPEPAPDLAEEANPAAKAEALPEHAAESEATPETGPDSEAEAEPGPEPTQAMPLQFDRMRSSPVPPSA